MPINPKPKKIFAPWLDGPGISLKKKKLLFSQFCDDIPARRAALKVGVHRHTADLWYRKWREIIYRSLQQAPRLSGEIQIDQHEFGGRAKKTDYKILRQLAGLPEAQQKTRGKKISEARAKKKKYPKIKVLGMLRTGGQVYVHIIKKEDAATLIPIVRLVIEQGSTIYSDKWPAFNELRLDGYKHHTINHSVEYVDKKGRHINGIESFWSWADRRLKNFIGIPPQTSALHIKECEFRFNNRKHVEKVLKSLIKIK